VPTVVDLMESGNELDLICNLYLQFNDYAAFLKVFELFHGKLMRHRVSGYCVRYELLCEVTGYMSTSNTRKRKLERERHAREKKDRDIRRKKRESEQKRQEEEKKRKAEHRKKKEEERKIKREVEVQKEEERRKRKEEKRKLDGELSYSLYQNLIPTSIILGKKREEEEKKRKEQEEKEREQELEKQKKEFEEKKTKGEQGGKKNKKRKE